jgi:hypothetical protein
VDARDIWLRRTGISGFPAFISPRFFGPALKRRLFVGWAFLRVGDAFSSGLWHVVNLRRVRSVTSAVASEMGGRASFSS